MQDVSSNLFVLSRKFSNFVLRLSSALGNFSTSLVLAFPQLLDALGKRLEFHINVKQDLK